MVEDEAEISGIQKAILSRGPFFHEVDVAPDGGRAEALFAKHHYDCISLDYILPGGMNGLDIYRLIRKSDTNVPVLFVSGNIEFLESIEDLKEKDPYIDHLSKPFRNIDYANGLNALLGKGR